MMNRMVQVIVINGTPGTGKSTVAQELANFGFKVITEREMTKLSDCMMGRDEEKKTSIIDEDCYEAYLHQYFQNEDKELVVYEGHLGDLVPSEFVLKCFVLSLQIEKLRERLKKRGYPPQKIEDNILAEIMKDCLILSQEAFGVEKTVEIENHDSHATAKRIIQEIKILLRDQNG
ncbi:MAG: hypothetical protein D6732_19450 [Methanobacteriota archaeon]|nr:MAG: hypothetical protein D6732_19450 [Euryarchaeota archaeon]